MIETYEYANPFLCLIYNVKKQEREDLTRTTWQFSKKPRKQNKNCKNLLRQEFYLCLQMVAQRKFCGRYGDFTKQYEVPLSRMLHDILDDDHIQWHPPLIRHYTNFWPLLFWTLLPNLTFYLIVQGSHRAYVTGAACHQRTLTPPDTWSCPTFGLACVLMSRPISHELVMFPDFWISNIPRFFSFPLIYNKSLVHLCIKTR